MRNRLLLAFSAMLLFANCQKREAEIPAYLHIMPFKLSATAAQGGNSQEITNGQVFVGSQFIGDYEFPITIPVTLIGNHQVSIFPSVKENGISNGRKVFKLYKEYAIPLVLVAGQIDTLSPEIKYKDNVNFVWVEDFDDNAISLEKGLSNNLLDSLITVSFNTPNGFKDFNRGFSAGVIFPTNSVGFTWEVFSVQSFKLPNKGKDVYMEMDLRSDINVTVGIVFIEGSQLAKVGVVTYFPTGGRYNKCYINLKPELSPLQDNIDIKIFIGGANFTTNDQTPSVFIDNIKLAYLQ